MLGYAGRILRVNLSDHKVSKEEISEAMRENFLGGRGFAAKLLWDEVGNADPLSENNKVIFATGPLTGQAIPSSGKMLIASKSPLTGGYGDGNIGTLASVQLRRAGYDVLVVEGRSEKPCYLLIQDDAVVVKDAQEFWGRSTFQVQEDLEKTYGKNAGILIIGPGGEKGVLFANVMSQKGRAGGRPGMGTVMGSKNLKAIVVKGNGSVSNFDDSRLKEIGKRGYAEIKSKKSYGFWMRQGTMQVFEWCNENACLPTNNFKESIFEFSKEMDGYVLEKLNADRKGCPFCNMQCGHVIKDSSNQYSELDYENVGMLGPNIGIKDLRQVALLNRIADEAGLDTISLGNCIGFLMEASGNRLISQKISWGDLERVQRLVSEIERREGLGEMASLGVKRMSEIIGRGSDRWAMHIKGLEISAYNCHSSPGMALSYGTSPIGGSHKDAWLIAWEMANDPSSYGKEKVEKLIEFQRIRGGFFEFATVCRLPWVEVDFGFHWYPQYLEAATGSSFTTEELSRAADRIYNLIRAYWIRENSDFSRKWDYPPDRWFEEPPSKGNRKGLKLDRENYDQMLSSYYELRGWDHNGIPLKETLDDFGLKEVSKELAG